MLLLPGIAGEEVRRRAFDVHRQHAGLTGGQLLVLGIEDHQAVAGHGYAHAADVLRVLEPVVVVAGHAGLGLAVVIHHRTAQRRLHPAHHFCIERLAR